MKKAEANALAAKIVQDFRAGIPVELIGPNKVQVRQLNTLRDDIAKLVMEVSKGGN